MELVEWEEQVEWMGQVDRKHLFDLADLMWPSEMNNKRSA